MADQEGYEPRSRQGRPWWMWGLGCCGGCLVVVVIVAVVAGAWLKNLFEKTDVGPVTQQTVQRQLGDVPLYPKARLDARVTESMMRWLRVTERITRHKQGGMFRALAALDTSDSAEQVLDFYRRKLKLVGWYPLPAKANQEPNQLFYGRANPTDPRQREGLMVQALTHRGGTQGTMVMLLLGTPEFVVNAPPLKATGKGGRQ